MLPPSIKTSLGHALFPRTLLWQCKYPSAHDLATWTCALHLAFGLHLLLLIPLSAWLCLPHQSIVYLPFWPLIGQICQAVHHGVVCFQLACQCLGHPCLHPYLYTRVAISVPLQPITSILQFSLWPLTPTPCCLPFCPCSSLVEGLHLPDLCTTSYFHNRVNPSRGYLTWYSSWMLQWPLLESPLQILLLLLGH